MDLRDCSNGEVTSDKDLEEVGDFGSGDSQVQDHQEYTDLDQVRDRTSVEVPILGVRATGSFEGVVD